MDTKSLFRWAAASCRVIPAAAVFALAALTAAAQTAPVVTSVTPANGATGVGGSTAIVVAFDQAMDVTLPLVPSIPGVIVGSFEISPANIAAFFAGTWGDDDQTLRLEPFVAVPAGTTVTWRLNPANTMFPIQSEDGGTLATISGSYTVGDGGPGPCDPDGVPDSWGSYGIYKSTSFRQLSDTVQEPATDELPFVFSAIVASPSGGPVVTSGSVTRPGGVQNALTFFGSVGQYVESPATEEALNTAAPAGGYTLRFTPTGQAERVINMTMPAGAVPRPRVANHAAAQAVNAGADFTLRWDAFSGADADDRIFLQIADGDGNTVFQAPDPCVPRDLPVNATSVVIPGGTLASNRVYEATLQFARAFYFSTNAVPEMSGLGTLTGATQFTIQTGGGAGPGAPATFGNFRLTPGGNPAFELTGTAGRSYGIQRSGSVDAANWPEIATVTMSTSGVAAYEDTQPAKVFPLYYRAVAK